MFNPAPVFGLAHDVGVTVDFPPGIIIKLPAAIIQLYRMPVPQENAKLEPHLMKGAPQQSTVCEGAEIKGLLIGTEPHQPETRQFRS